MAHQQSEGWLRFFAPWGTWMVMPLETRRRCSAFSPPFSSTMPKSICSRHQRQGQGGDQDWVQGRSCERPHRRGLVLSARRYAGNAQLLSEPNEYAAVVASGGVVRNVSAGGKQLTSPSVM